MSRSSLKWIGISLIACIVVLFAIPVKNWLSDSVIILDDTAELILDWGSIVLIGILFAAFLAPLEALGWWAGWYGDRLDTSEVHPVGTHRLGAHISRYVLYLDGISLASSYTSDVEMFLRRVSTELPQDILLIQGLMPYSVINRPLTEDRLLGFFWRIADSLRLSKTGGMIAEVVTFAINIHNLLVVAVSADKRYGPIYNQGTAQVIYNSLINHGYQPQSGKPITLIGYSGGGQIAMGTATFLKQALDAPIEVISLAGVISGNINALEVEHIYHLVGKKDFIERLGPILFPRRWKIFFLSYWNRAKRRGKISFIPLGPISHDGPAGPLSQTRCLADGRSYLQQTVEIVAEIIKGKYPLPQSYLSRQSSNYDRYWQAPFNRPNYYPLNCSVDPDLYQPIAPWMGRLILPTLEQRYQVKGGLLEVYHAPGPYQRWVGQVVNLRWSNDQDVQSYVRTVTQDVHFSEEAEYSLTQGLIEPERLNHWRQVDPLESLAGARPHDDLVVMLEPVKIDEGNFATSTVATLFIAREPVQISGRYYGLVKFLQPIGEDDASPECFRVVHYNSISQQFDGKESVVYLPTVIPNHYGVTNSTNRDLEKSPLNPIGWYIYGAPNASGTFVVQAIAPRALLRLQPEQLILGKRAAIAYIEDQSWKNVKQQKGRIASVLLQPQKGEDDEVESGVQAINGWRSGDRALLIHLYGGIGGNKAEPATQGPVYFGHFAYGVAQVVHDPLTRELRFEINYYQVYTHNKEGIISGILHWSRYMGDRQFGWLGVRPTSNILIKLDAFTKDYCFGDRQQSALEAMLRQLEVMMARYRVGDGTGVTYVGPANNCVQDSNQALYATLKFLQTTIQNSVDSFPDWEKLHLEEAQRLGQLIQVREHLRRKLLPWGTARADWLNSTETLGLSLEDYPLKTLLRGLISWRTMLPRIASEAIVKVFLQQGASVWVLRTNQVGGSDPDIEPVAPVTF